MANGKPTYIYKLIPGSRPDLLPSPIPNQLPLSELDQRDGFMHLSTSIQVPGTVQRFFRDESHVNVLRLEYAALEANIKWEDPRGEHGEIGAENVFPHLYREPPLGKNDIAEVFELTRDSGGWDIDTLKKNSKLVY